MDKTGEILTQFVTLMIALWASVEFLPKAIRPLRRLNKETLAAWLGPAYALIAQGTGLVDVGSHLPETLQHLPGWAHSGAEFVGAGFMGLIATAITGSVNDRGIKPALGTKTE